MNRTGWLRRGRRRPSRSAGDHVRLVTRLLVAQAAVAAAVSLLFSRRAAPVVVTTLMFVAAICLLAAFAHTGTPAARTVVLGFEFAVIVFGLYRFFFERYLGGTIFAIVITAVLLQPAAVRAYGAEPAGRAEPVDAVSVADSAGGLGESARH
ncbi:MAG: hypothetical protein ACM3ML_11715 [Micromonosporaceae bacterium]